VGVTAADAAAIAAEADIVVEFPFSGVPGNKTLKFNVSSSFKLLQTKHGQLKKPCNQREKLIS
jgi:hypothetical protein